YRDFTAIILSNSVWRDSVAGIPYDKRLLLLPKCLRNQDKCPGHFDELGLVCEHCGSCVIDEFKAQAERLGYAVLIAEGSPVVMALIETGKIEAVVGVSCTSVLERVFPYMEAGAVPGIAIPLLYDGCVNTHVDVDWVWEAIYQSTDTRDGRLNLDDLRNSVEEWFTRESLESLLASDKGQTEELAFEWMAKAGKRWRPFLAACAYQALNPNKSDALLDTIRRASVAIECFHKASLIHDDIEDNDTTRYEAKTLHTEYGVPVALNIGDFLLGEGYRLLAELKVPDALRVAVVQTAAEGHRTLCLGQGAELSWTRRPGPLSVAEVINIYRKKTSPAFEVALKIGAILGKGGDELTQSLERYSWALGIAYQIRDDVEDFYAKGTFKVPGEIRPSLLLAQAYEMAYGEDKTLLESIWNTSVPLHSIADKLEKVFEKLGIEQLALDLMESYKYRAINSLALIKNAGLKGLLRRVAGKIFNEFEVMGCCNDHKAGHGRSRESSD
ncbi:MAG: polyprenyl synthetase family protein, partial [Sedimentisphaerales bacterium]|nr:polyprenyl synthetase family protein [Sedimentisphaerales bacterium]